MYEDAKRGWGRDGVGWRAEAGGRGIEYSQFKQRRKTGMI
jgi:hypothetical protein